MHKHLFSPFWDSTTGLCKFDCLTYRFENIMLLNTLAPAVVSEQVSFIFTCPYVQPGLLSFTRE